MTGHCTWPVPSPADAARAAAGIAGDTRRGLPPKTSELLMLLAFVHHHDESPPPGQWACRRCGAAWFGTPPEGCLCPGCAGVAA